MLFIWGSLILIPQIIVFICFNILFVLEIKNRNSLMLETKKLESIKIPQFQPNSFSIATQQPRQPIPSVPPPPPSIQSNTLPKIEELINSFYNPLASKKVDKYLSIKHIGNDEFEFSITKVKTSVALIPYPGVSSRYLALPVNNSISSSDFKDKLQSIYRINDFNIYADWKKSYKIEIQSPAILDDSNEITCFEKGLLRQNYHD